MCLCLRVLMVALLSGGASLCECSGQGSVISVSNSFVIGSGISLFLEDGFRITFATDMPKNPESTIFGGLLLTTNDTGNSFTVNPSNDAGFNGFASRLTDGQPGNLWFAFTNKGASIGVGEDEGSFLRDVPGSGDLTGYNLSSIDLRMDHIAVTTNGWGGDDLSVTYTLSFNGTPVPEPSTLMFAAAGALLVSLESYRRRPRRPATGP
jgi:hypothetical protein